MFSKIGPGLRVLGNAPGRTVYLVLDTGNSLFFVISIKTFVLGKLKIHSFLLL